MQSFTPKTKEFLAYAAQLKGDEKGESQVFLDHFDFMLEARSVLK